MSLSKLQKDENGEIILEEYDNIQITAKKEEAESQIENGGSTDMWENQIKKWKDESLID